jgi:hypothetical protein
MSQKSKQYFQWQEAQKRDAELCQRPGCKHPRGWHVGDKNRTARQINQCDCPEFVPAPPEPARAA